MKQQGQRQPEVLINLSQCTSPKISEEVDHPEFFSTNGLIINQSPNKKGGNYAKVNNIKTSGGTKHL